MRVLRIVFLLLPMHLAINQVDPRAKEPHVPSVDLEFRVVGIDGSPIEQKKFQNRQFRTLDVCNLPRRGQKTACAIPSDPVLELVSQLTDSGKKKKASTQVCACVLVLPPYLLLGR